MTKITEKISALKEKLQALEAEQKARERAARQAEKTRSRKEENRRKYELGGLLKIADLFDKDKGALLGALLTLTPSLADPTKFSDFKKEGDALLARLERARQAGKDESYLQ